MTSASAVEKRLAEMATLERIAAVLRLRLLTQATLSTNGFHVPNFSAVQTRHRHQEYAEAMFKKDARINIRLPSKDLRGLQKRALAEGIPYQTLVASVLLKYIEGRLHESGD